MRPLVIFGAGGLGRELLGTINASSATFKAQWPISAFVDDDARPGAICGGLPVLRRDGFAHPPRYLLAIGAPRTRRQLAGELARLGWEAPTLVHESVHVGQGAEIGEGSVILQYSSVSADAKIGRFVLVNGRCGIAHDARVGDYSVLLGGDAVSGNVAIGDDVLVGSSVVIHPGLTVGDGAIVGIGSVVIRSVPPGVTVFGNPAKQLRGAAAAASLPIAGQVSDSA